MFWLAAGLIGGALISRQTAIDATKREIAAARNERDNHFVNLRNSARRGGFNPLTALRTTGGGGYGQYVPLLSRSAVGEGNRAMGQFASNYIRDAAFMGANQAHEKTMTRMNNDAAMDRTKTQIANKPKSGFDYGYVDRIKVKFGGKTIELKSNIARRLDILPGDDLMPGELSEIGGEFWGEVISAVGTEAAAEVLGVEITDLLNTDNDKSGTGYSPQITRNDMPSLDSIELYNSQWFRDVQTALSRNYTQPTFEQKAQGWANESAKHVRQYAGQ